MKKPLITFYETKHFVKHSTKLLGVEGREDLRRSLADNPKAGDIIPGGGGSASYALHVLAWENEVV